MSAVPDSIGQLSALRVLDLNDNHLRTLPRSIAGLRSLESLWLEDNPLSEEALARIRALLPARCRLIR